MPPWTPSPPGRRPTCRLGLGVLVAFPERKVTRILLAARVGVSGWFHVVDVLVGQGTVRRPGLHIEIDIARTVGCRIGMTAFDQHLDHFDHLGDVTCGPRLYVGGRQPSAAYASCSSRSK